MILPITLTIAGAAALVNIWLGLRVSGLRRQHKVSIGHGDNPLIASRMRAHANFVEYTPFFLILLALVEMAKGSQTWLWVAAIAYVLARLAHPFGMDRPGANLLRLVGVGVTWLVLLGLAGYALSIPYMDEADPAPVSFTASPSDGGTKLT